MIDTAIFIKFISFIIWPICLLIIVFRKYPIIKKIVAQSNDSFLYYTKRQPRRKCLTSNRMGRPNNCWQDQRKENSK